MNDTSEKVDAYFRALLMKKSPEERLRMGCSMFMTAKRIAEVSIRAAQPNISASELRQRIFLRFYGGEFDNVRRKKILKALS